MAQTFSVAVEIGGKLNASLGAAVRAAEAQVGRLGRSIVAANARTQATVSSMGRGIGSAGKKLQQAGRQFSTSVSAPTGLLAFGAGKMAFEFEKAGNLLEALGDASEEQRKKFEGLANELNKKYPQSLADIIRTGNEMLKGGFTFDQMTGAIDQTLATAVLGDMSPSEVGNMMARTLNSFQMPMKTYEEAMRSSTQVSDRMTYAAVKTTASLRDMGEMFRYVGGAMSASGQDIDAATAFAMAFAKNGTVGSEAGVALRSAVVRMVKMPAKGMASLNRIGMNLNDYVGGKQALSSDRILAGLESGGIDASGVKGQIDKLLKSKLANSPAKLTAAITKTIQSHLGSDSAIDASAIAENVQDSITAAGSKIDLMRFFTDLQKKLKDGTANLGDVATILEGRHFARYQAILQSDLGALLSGVQNESGGYTQGRYGIALKGMVGAWYELTAAVEKFSTTLGRATFPALASGISAVADAIQSLSEASPSLVKFGAWAGLATIALGPFMMAAGATARVLGPLASGIFNLALSLSFGLAGRLTTVAAGLIGLLNPMNLLRGSVTLATGAIRGFGTALRIALIGTGVGAVLAGIVAAGVWIYNNWNGITEAFRGFGDVIAQRFPGAASLFSTIAEKAQAIFKWVSDLLGPLDATNQQWRSWGETVGGVVVGAVDALGRGIDRVVGLFTAAYDKAVALKNAVAGFFGGGGPISNDAAAAAVGGEFSVLSGARAAGGPVSAGRSYLVGERGPEIFTPSRTGRIETNARLRSLADGGIGYGSRGARGGVRSENHFYIQGAQDPRAVAREVESVLRRLESEQRGLLSD